MGGICTTLLACILWAHESVIKPNVDKLEKLATKEGVGKVEEKVGKVEEKVGGVEEKVCKEMAGMRAELLAELRGFKSEVNLKLDRAQEEVALHKGFALCGVVVAALWLLHRQR